MSRQDREETNRSKPDWKKTIWSVITRNMVEDNTTGTQLNNVRPSIDASWNLHWQVQLSSLLWVWHALLMSACGVPGCFFPDLWAGAVLLSICDKESRGNLSSLAKGAEGLKWTQYEAASYKCHTRHEPLQWSPKCGARLLWGSYWINYNSHVTRDRLFSIPVGEASNPDSLVVQPVVWSLYWLSCRSSDYIIYLIILITPLHVAGWLRVFWNKTRENIYSFITGCTCASGVSKDGIWRDQWVGFSRLGGQSLKTISTLWYFDLPRNNINFHNLPPPSLPVSEKCSSAHCCRSLPGCTVTSGT
jgi:hypothetical protein